MARVQLPHTLYTKPFSRRVLDRIHPLVDNIQSLPQSIPSADTNKGAVPESPLRPRCAWITRLESTTSFHYEPAQRPNPELETNRTCLDATITGTSLALHQ